MTIPLETVANLSDTVYPVLEVYRFCRPTVIQDRDGVDLGA
jgi:hypothetical protein